MWRTGIRWLSETDPQLCSSSGFRNRKRADLQYQSEAYLRAFLDNGEIPIDNGACEQAVRPFCVGRKAWNIIDTVEGAQASAIAYSIAETAKANNLKPYQYFEYLLTELPKRVEETKNAEFSPEDLVTSTSR